ncbi:MAG: hypothetical protein JXB35_00685 [Anaerolineae bacterium]|nr:hypothetical protein [Anaerolineae bacterium]
MSRLTKVFGKLAKVRGRKKARFRAYHSETMALKMDLVQRDTPRTRGRTSRK